VTPMPKWELWLRGIAAAAISGAANGAVNGFCAMGIAPDRFNLQAQFHNTLLLVGISAAFGALLGLALYLKQSPLPPNGVSQ